MKEVIYVQRVHDFQAETVGADIYSEILFALIGT